MPRPIRRARTVLVALALLVPLLAAGPAAAQHPERRSGSDRYATAAALSRDAFPGGADVVHVVTGAGFADALVAGVAAGRAGGPVLLVTRTTVPAATATELDRLAPTEVVVVGGGASVSDEVLDELGRRAGAPVTRVEGANRFATAAAVSSSTFPAAPEVWIASGRSFPDALAGVPAAVRAGAPLLLATRDTLPADTAAEVDRLGATRAVVLGGPASVGPSVVDALRARGVAVERIQGADRYATAVAVSARSATTGAPVHLATGSAYADALAAGPVVAAGDGPLLLVRTNCVPGVVLAELSRLGAGPGGAEVVLVGGEAALGRGVEDLARCPDRNRPAPVPTVSPSATPAWDDDGPDPHVVRFGDTWYAYTTGTTWGNHIGVLVSDRPDGGWRTTTGQPYGSTALDGYPSWQVRDTQWAPAVYRFAGRYVLFYAAQRASTLEWCLSVATATAPTGPFRDRTSGPIVCADHEDGVIDPHPFVDADGTPWLHFKTNDGFGTPTNDASAVSRVLATRLAADGTTPIGRYHEVLVKDTTRYPWQTTVDNPQMVLVDGRYLLLHTGGNYVGDDTYAVGVAVCDGPTGPCTTRAQPILTTASHPGDVAGPGGGTLARGADGRWWMSYHAWPSGCFDYSCGERRMYVAPVSF